LREVLEVRFAPLSLLRGYREPGHFSELGSGLKRSAC
jgi:hypothetical protein